MERGRRGQREGEKETAATRRNELARVDERKRDRESESKERRMEPM